MKQLFYTLMVGFAFGAVVVYQTAYDFPESMQDTKLVQTRLAGEASQGIARALQIHESGLPIPPQTAWINARSFMDQFEVSAADWSNFLQDLKRTQPQQYDQALKDMATNLRDFAADQPITGVSHQWVQAYCDWRSEQMNQRYGNMLADQGKCITFSFRLPTNQEWELAALGMQNPQFSPYGFNREQREAHSRIANCVIGADSTSAPAAVAAFLPNAYGLYNMIGNVAEMTNRAGVAKGGSFQHRIEECEIGKFQPFDKPQNWLGFRCICDVTIDQI